MHYFWLNLFTFLYYSWVNILCGHIRNFYIDLLPLIFVSNQKVATMLDNNIIGFLEFNHWEKMFSYLKCLKKQWVFFPFSPLLVPTKFPWQKILNSSEISPVNFPHENKTMEISEPVYVELQFRVPNKVLFFLISEVWIE